VSYWVLVDEGRFVTVSASGGVVRQYYQFFLQRNAIVTAFGNHLQSVQRRFSMLSGPQRPIILLAFFLITPILTLASSIEVNSVCEVGICPLPTNNLAPGSSIPLTNFNFEAVINGDTYDFYGTYSAYNTSNSPSGSVGITLDATAVYEGSAPTVQDDEILLNDLQNNTVPGSFNLNKTYTESLTASFSGTLVKNTSLRGQTFFNGDGLGSFGIFSGAGSNTVVTPLSLTGTILDEDMQAVFDFGVGTLPGTSITAMGTASLTATPEPAGIIPLAAILALCLGIPAIRRSRLASKRVS
jgi:hypothetical protein